MDDAVALRVPRVAVGVVVFRGDEVLLVLRGRAPAHHVWAVPGGSVNLGESLRQAAEREVFEETGVTVRAREIVHAFDVIERHADGTVRHHYVVVDVTADWVAGEPHAADDALDARWHDASALREGEVSAETARLVARLRSRVQSKSDG